MLDYRVHLVTDLPEPTEEEFDAIVDRLEPVAGVPSAPTGTLALTLSASAADAFGAVEAGRRAVGDVLDALGRTASVITIETELDDGAL